jgi:integrase
MGRTNKLIKTKYASISQSKMENGEVNYFTFFSHNGKRYGEKNLTKLFGITTAKSAFDKLNEIKIELSKGVDVFSRKSNKIDDLIVQYLSTKDEAYKRNSTATYNKHIKPVIGHLKIDIVKKEHILKIISNMEKLKLSSNTIKKIKVILNPIFKEAYQDEVIQRNILEKASFGKDIPKPLLTDRILEPLLEAVKKIYAVALSEDRNYASLFLISIMCGRRIGEIIEIKYNDIIDGYVNVRASTTKTYKKDRHISSIIEKYPLPLEVLERIDKENNSNEKVFKHYKRRYLDKYKKMIDTKCDLKLKNLANEYPIRSHDNRNFIMSILSREFGREVIGSVCLSHSSRSSNMNERYDVIEDKDKMKIYESYWNKLRN